MRVFQSIRLFPQGRALAATLAGIIFSFPAAAAPGAVTIDVGSIGVGVDGQAISSLRRIVGSAIATGAADSFLVYAPRSGGPIPIEGGLSACAEKGFAATNRSFATFISRLRAVRASSGTVISVKGVANCPALGDTSGGSGGGIACTQEVKICPDGVTAVGRVGPNCEFAPCPGEK